jgi:hypothetical protein
MITARYQAARPPVAAATPQVVVIGAPSPLRSAVVRELRTGTALLVCLDRPTHLPAVKVDGGLAGGTVVFVTVPQPPGFAGRLRHKFRAKTLAAEFEQAVISAHGHGAAQVIVLSTVFRYCDDGRLPLQVDSPVLDAAETARAAAAERAARLFSELGGDSVVLRLGWTCGRGEGIVRRVMSAARRGWQLIDGPPGGWVAMIAEPDAARVVVPALTVPPGTYNVTDGQPVTQAALNADLAAWVGKELHPLDDPHWGPRGVLFGPSRMIADSTFADLSGWRPQTRGVAEYLLSRRAGY